jgi:tartrate dehydrogenase/decarboxylase/D-malate dehydrogenase
MPQPEPKTCSIAVIPGDGVGREVVPAAVTVLERLGERFGIEFDFRSFDWGSDYYVQHGRMMPSDALDQLRSADAILLGAIGHPKIQDNVTLNGLLLPIRRAFDQFVNVRPAILYPGVRSPIVGVEPGSVDMVVVRENTEGEYAQVGGFVHLQTSNEVAVQASVFTRQGVERVIRYAFELATKRNGRKRATSITKSNAQGFGMVLWDRVFDEVKFEYPQIETESLLVDAATIHLIKRPQSFDVIVASNLFGDILSDLTAAVTGSIGLAASANLDPLAPVSVDVRTGARFRAGHCGKGSGQPAGHLPLCGDDARAPGMERGGRRPRQCSAESAQRRSRANGRPRRRQQHPASD